MSTRRSARLSQKAEGGTRKRYRDETESEGEDDIIPKQEKRREVPAVVTKPESVQKAAAEQPAKSEITKPPSDKGELQASSGGTDVRPKKKRAKKEKEKKPLTKRICASWAKRLVHGPVHPSAILDTSKASCVVGERPYPQPQVRKRVAHRHYLLTTVTADAPICTSKPPALTHGTWLAHYILLMALIRDHGLTDRDLEALSYESAPNPHYYGAPMKLYLEHEVSDPSSLGSGLHVSELQMYSRSPGRLVR